MNEYEWRPQPKGPTPQEYLRAGIPPRTSKWGEYFVQSGSTEPLPDRARDMSVVELDDDGAPTAMHVSRHPPRYLTRPPRDQWWPDGTIAVERQASGFLRATASPGSWQQPHPKWPDREPLPTDRVVTIDLSVLEYGLRPELFRANDVLFVSAALTLDLVVHLISTVEDEERSTLFGHWMWSEPVPIDSRVTLLARDIAGADRVWRTPPLYRSDLMCAAFANLYKAPLYTTRPEAYEGLDKSVRTIEYGPIRNKAAIPKEQA